MKLDEITVMRCVAVAGATDAARAAADIVLLEPGLSVIIDAMRGSRKIFRRQVRDDRDLKRTDQTDDESSVGVSAHYRMKNYTTYAIATTIRIVFLFSILTIAFDFYFPVVLIVIMAVLNDGTILTISRDRVKPSPVSISVAPRCGSIA